MLILVGDTSSLGVANLTAIVNRDVVPLLFDGACSISNDSQACLFTVVVAPAWLF